MLTRIGPRLLTFLMDQTARVEEMSGEFLIYLHDWYVLLYADADEYIEHQRRAIPSTHLLDESRGGDFTYG